MSPEKRIAFLECQQQLHQYAPERLFTRYEIFVMNCPSKMLLTFDEWLEL